jgi:hypothetical protein
VCGAIGESSLSMLEHLTCPQLFLSETTRSELGQRRTCAEEFYRSLQLSLQLQAFAGLPADVNEQFQASEE